MATDVRAQQSTFDITSPAYLEKVYAGVLGKIIGVYLGRPFEGWKFDQIKAELGEVDHYVHEKFGVPLIVTDDDIAGTFTFLRALQDNGYDPNLTPAQIGDGWLNYLIEKRTVLWWGGMGVSTENTAYLRLASGIKAPLSGSRELNGLTISEQIGAQIFIDGWAMLFPGDPEKAADWARRAGSVSHDGEAIYGAQMIAAMEAQAFVERDINTLIDTALQFIPKDSIIARMIADVRSWHAANDDWYATRALIGEHYNYEKFVGACHMVPNHALIIFALLYGNGDFRRSQMIVNTSGWDTDCNAGNIGNILGIRDGLAAFDETPDFRLPVADKLYLSTAEGGRGISDALAETYHVVNAARALQGVEPIAPKDGARFHFSLPGSVQGFVVDDEATASVTNVDAQLQIALTADEAVVTTPTFAPVETRPFRERGYTLFASPTLYSGQEVTTTVVAPAANGADVAATLIIRVYDESDELQLIEGPTVTVAAGTTAEISWEIPALDNQPIQQIGFRVNGAAGDALLVDRVTWSGAPTTTFRKGTGSGDMWQQAWINGADIWELRWGNDFHVTQNRGIGLIAQGTSEWTDYTATTVAKSPLAKSAGLAVRIGGMTRYYALVLADTGKAQIVKRRGGDPIVLAEVDFAWNVDQEYAFELTAQGNQLRGSIDGTTVLEATDDDQPLTGGSVGLVVEVGTIAARPISVAKV